MSSASILILGTTLDGRTFRPSDWAERLAGVMSQFKPEGCDTDRLGYSPWCLPTAVEGVSAVIISRELEAEQPLAWQFLQNFAKDNQLQLGEAPKV